jgi:excisionase family DNA binding protein
MERKTCTIEEAAKILKIARGSAYAAARRGDLPVIDIGRRRLVLWEPLMRMLDGASASV